MKNQLTKDIKRKGPYSSIKLIEIPNLDIGGGDSRNPIENVKSREEAI